MQTINDAMRRVVYLIPEKWTGSSMSNFHPLEVVSRYRDPQIQVGVNYSIYVQYVNRHSANLLFINTHCIHRVKIETSYRR